MKFSEIYKEKPNNIKDFEVASILCDSRKVVKNSVFFCITGSVTDGHNFAESAYDNGASAIFCEKDLGLSNQIIVDDTKAVYSLLCANYFGNPAKKLKLIGITGTSGKTSVTYMTKSLLEKQGKKVGLIGTIQNIIGDSVLPAKNTTPDAYELHSLFELMVKNGCEYVVMEVSSHALDQKRVYNLDFECAVFTNLTQDHLDYHMTMENYLQAKLKLFKMAKTAIVNLDDDYSDKVLEACECPVITFSTESNEADYTAKEIKFLPNGVNYELVTNCNIGRVKISTPGIFSVYNSMAAGIVGISIGIPFNEVIAGLCEVSVVKGRVELVPCDKGFTPVIDYAHTPDELENVCNMLNKIKKGRLVTVFGCGGDRDKTKRPIMGEIAARLSDFAVVTSDNPRSEDPNLIIEDILVGMKGIKTPYKVIENRAQAIEYALKNARKDDIILLAGKGHETYQILAEGTIHFDEREVIADCLAKM
ncbi:MAG: UDP-N-acetylmuramoyl-L-alanyl-D-glutamate--2,6-diaminopimelate ligase [Clostridia bacterium]|nr:UDP-N-acetylmuramoyl-L-alanyl-D-glutamate--2,6-diaminopimelate ligase [Clostridia bacterium]